VVQWLVHDESVEVNPLDRHYKTPLEVGEESVSRACSR
jgi:hypothetical protein